MITLDVRKLKCSFSSNVDNAEIIKFHKMPIDEVQVLERDQQKSCSVARKWLYLLTFIEILVLLTAGYFIYRCSTKFRMVKRQQWGAVKPVYKRRLSLPVQYVVIDENPYECNTTEACSFYMKELQRYRIESQIFADTDSNFFIGGDGLIYEGTGWHVNPMPMGIVYNNFTYLAICVLGNFNKMETVQRQWTAVQRLVAEGKHLGNISPDFKLFSRCQIDKYGSSRSKIYDLVQKSKHYSTDLSWFYAKFEEKLKF